MPDFYDELAPWYHLIFQDWAATVRHQGEQLGALIRAEWPASRHVLDVSCGIGTQTIGLALQGWKVAGSDLSPAAISRAREEAGRFGLDIGWSAADMRRAHDHHGSGHDVVICCDNSLPHLLNDADLMQALTAMRACLAPGGGCLISVRDYAAESRGRHLVKPYGVRLQTGKRFLLFQVWDFDEGDCYDLSFFIVEEDLATQQVQTHVMRSRYYAVTIDHLIDLMQQAGFADVRRIDGAYYQPVLVGTKPG